MYKAIYYLVLILLVSCTSESRDILDSNENQGCGIPVQFTYTIENLEDVDTRSIISSSHLPDDSRIGVYALQENCIDKSAGTYELLKEPLIEWSFLNFQTWFENAQYKSSESSTVFSVVGENERGIYPVGVTNPALRIYAYHPYSKFVSDGGSLKYVYGQAPYLTITQAEPFSVENQIDYLYTGCVHSLAEDEYAELSFHHAQARISISLRNVHSATSVSVQDITIVTTQSQSGKLNIATGEFSPDSGTSTITLTTGWSVDHLDDKKLGDFLLFPCETGTETIESIHLTINGEPKDVYNKNTATKPINLARGKVVYVEFQY